MTPTPSASVRAIRCRLNRAPVQSRRGLRPPRRCPRERVSSARMGSQRHRRLASGEREQWPERQRTDVQWSRGSGAVGRDVHPQRRPGAGGADRRRTTGNGARPRCRRGQSILRPPPPSNSTEHWSIMTTLISTQEELTPDWLGQALGDAGRLTTGTVTDVAAKRIGSGRLGTTYLLTPGYSAGPTVGPERLVAKLPATDDASRQFSAAMGAYTREVSFYRDIATHVPVRTPECYHAAVSDDGLTFCLLLEDLTPAAECDQVEGCDVDRAERALRQAAALHAGSWNDRGLQRYAWLDSGLGIWRKMGADAAQAQKAFRAGYDGLLDDASHRVAAGLETGI